MTARIYPALFPGQTLTGVLPGGSRLAQLPGPIKVSAPSDDSILNKRINLLVFGIDRRPFDADLDEFRTDTIMIATIDPVSKQASVLSIPRDVAITINHPDGSQYEDRVNSSYAVGVETGKSHEAGARQMMKDIKANFGIEIDYWVQLDFVGVYKLVDALGGLEVDVPEELEVPDWWYSDESGEQAHWVSYPAGLQHMDGYDAVAFGRYRDSGGGDLDRVRRQQLILQTAMSRLFSQGLLKNPLELWNAYSGLVKTNIPTLQLVGMAKLAEQTGGEMATYSLGQSINGVPTVEDYLAPSGAEMLRLNPENVQIILGQMFSKASYARSWVEIHDGIGGEEGDLKADGLRRYLHFSKGLPTVYIGPDDHSVTRSKITVFAEEWRPMAEDIADWMGLPKSSIVTGVRPAGVVDLDVIVTIGDDYRVPGS